MRNIFIKTLNALASKDKDLYLITGDLGFNVLTDFMNSYPDQFINSGICEQNMTSVAAGIALEGKTVFTYSIGNFPTLRCLEQIRNDCSYHDANVKIVSVGGGFAYGALGMTHHATEDIAALRALPNTVVVAPGDLTETEYATKAVYEYKGTCYLRLGKGGEKKIHKSINNFQIGKAIIMNNGYDVAIFSTGGILEEALNASRELNQLNISTALVSFPTVKPIDKEVILSYANKVSLIVTVEEHNIIGGFGSAVAEILAENHTKAIQVRLGMNDTYSSIVGSQAFLREYYGLSSSKIVGSIKSKINKI